MIKTPCFLKIVIHIKSWSRVFFIFPFHLKKKTKTKIKNKKHINIFFISLWGTNAVISQALYYYFVHIKSQTFSHVKISHTVWLGDIWNLNKKFWFVLSSIKAHYVEITMHTNKNLTTKIFGLPEVIVYIIEIRKKKE